MRLQANTGTRNATQGWLYILSSLVLVQAYLCPVSLGQSLSNGDGDLRVMTYNANEGTDFLEVQQATDPVSFLVAVGQTITQVRATNPSARMKALAKQIIAPALNTLIRGPSKLLETSGDLIKGAMQRLVDRAIESGDVRRVRTGLAAERIGEAPFSPRTQQQARESATASGDSHLTDWTVFSTLYFESDPESTQLDAALPISAWINRGFVISSNGV